MTRSTGRSKLSACWRHFSRARRRRRAAEPGRASYGDIDASPSARGEVPRRNSRASASAAAAKDSVSKDSAATAAPVSTALSAIERVRLARHPSRPQTLDYVEHLVRDFFEIHGDRRFADDGAIVAGLGYFGRRAVAIVGHQRGRSTAGTHQAQFRQAPSRGLPQGGADVRPRGPHRASRSSRLSIRRARSRGSARRSADRPRRSPPTWN